MLPCPEDTVLLLFSPNSRSCHLSASALAMIPRPWGVERDISVPFVGVDSTQGLVVCFCVNHHPPHEEMSLMRTGSCPRESTHPLLIMQMRVPFTGDQLLSVPPPQRTR